MRPAGSASNAAGLARTSPGAKLLDQLGHRRAQPHVAMQEVGRWDLQRETFVWIQQEPAHIQSHPKIQVTQLWLRITLNIGKGRLVKNDMARDDQSVGREIKAAVSFMMSGIT